MSTTGFLRVAVAVVVLALAGCAAARSVRTPPHEPALRIEVAQSSGWPEVSFENSVYKAVIRVNPGGGDFGNEHAIRDLILKDASLDIVSDFIDACAQRGPLAKASVTIDLPDRKTVRLEYHGKPGQTVAVSEYTVFADSPVIRIDYLQYPAWTNSVDIADFALTSGEGMLLEQAETRLYGQEEFEQTTGRGIVFHEESYWNTFDEPQKSTDPADGGPLNYRGHLIMAVAEKTSGIGFGRVMPVRSPGKGGISILKLLWNRGFECFAATGQRERAPFTGYVYVFTGGPAEAVEMGKRIVDGDMLTRYQAARTR